MHSASTASVNGYRIARHLDSYTNSVRLLQNVLHNAVQGTVLNQSSHQNTLQIYYSGNPSDPFTSPFGYSVTYYGSGKTIAELMINARDVNNNPVIYSNSDIAYDPDVVPPGKSFIGRFTIPVGYPGDGDYVAPPPATTEDKGIAFWFYSVNGGPGPMTSGINGESYSDYKINPGDRVFWQVIAPGPQYGFKSCGQKSAKAAYTSIL
ncbi:MAG: hypothetical protein EWV67_02900 [Microcystis sp. M_QC_C_20170808_M2Col]|uniref:hypothetical protein n=1 Tax=unclassified Microcystis TaxID=2643300 RepID=UPI00118F7378|nr:MULTISPECIES: hypothetical protein [unclassified Microcystis]MCA2745517.1 hypothetical protein [Microcystis sp. M155S2]TRT68176.1 MAG: hypothetical protein EWV67_02900 [Microcystis sp. M_QC_C_20170808_M2Col]